MQDVKVVENGVQEEKEEKKDEVRSREESEKAIVPKFSEACVSACTWKLIISPRQELARSQDSCEVVVNMLCVLLLSTQRSTHSNNLQD